MRTNYLEGFNGLAVGDVVYIPETKEERKLAENIFRMITQKHIINNLDTARPYIKTGLVDILTGENGEHVTYDSGGGFMCNDYKEMAILLSVQELLEETDNVRFKFNGADEFSLSLSSTLGIIVFETYSEFQRFQEERNDCFFRNGCFTEVNVGPEEEAEEEHGFYRKGFKVYIA